MPLLFIPDLSLQAALIAGCKRRGIKVLAVAGAGAKADPTRLRVVDMSEASVDPLAKAVRQKWVCVMQGGGGMSSGGR